jgi:CheY-like chemotaxis protein
MTATVLLCDDEIHILRAAEIKLKRAGFNVICALDGVEAWELIQENAPDVLVTDCQMPRMDGEELVQHVRSHAPTREIPILMLTAKGFELDQKRLAEEWNVAAVIDKPFSPRQLAQNVTQLIENGSCEQPQTVLP